MQLTWIYNNVLEISYKVTVMVNVSLSVMELCFITITCVIQLVVSTAFSYYPLFPVGEVAI